MMLYVLIGLCLSLVGIAGLQFMYLFYLERLDAERKKCVVELEHRCKVLSARLATAESRISQQKEIIEGLEVRSDQDEEAWADLLDDG